MTFKLLEVVNRCRSKFSCWPGRQNSVSIDSDGGVIKVGKPMGELTHGVKTLRGSE